jgi:hypothetical protein
MIAARALVGFALKSFCAVMAVTGALTLLTAAVTEAGQVWVMLGHP